MTITRVLVAIDRIPYLWKNRMLEQLCHHPHFTPWSDPLSGVTSYILNTDVAPCIQSFYFTNQPLSRDQKTLWFYACYPPARYHIVGVMNLDPAHPNIQVFPQASFESESVMVEPDGNSCWYTEAGSVKRIFRDGTVEIFATLPDDFVANRRIYRTATHLTRSCDGKYLLLDGQIGNSWFVGVLDLQTRAFRLIKEFTRNYNHGQFSTAHPDLFTLAMDHYYDAISGRRYHYDNRIWLLNTAGTQFETLTPDCIGSHLKGDCHEWWSPDGKVCWVNYEQGVYEMDLTNRTKTLVWGRPLCHAQCDHQRELWVADDSPYFWKTRPCAVRFYQRSSKREIDIASGMPEPTVQRSWYHIDPHPQFSPKDDAVIYTTTVNQGRTQLAICPVENILKALV